MIMYPMSAATVVAVVPIEIGWWLRENENVFSCPPHMRKNI